METPHGYEITEFTDGSIQIARTANITARKIIFFLIMSQVEFVKYRIELGKNYNDIILNIAKNDFKL